MSHVLHVLKTKVNVRVFFWNKFSLLDTFGYMHMCWCVPPTWRWMEFWLKKVYVKKLGRYVLCSLFARTFWLWAMASWALASRKPAWCAAGVSQILRYDFVLCSFRPPRPHSNMHKIDSRLSCVPCAVAWVGRPVWQRCDFPGLLIN